MNIKRPTVGDVDAYMVLYAREKGYALTFTAEQWHDYYESNGWKVGRNAMKDWKAAVRTWFHKQRQGQINAANRYANQRELGRQQRAAEFASRIAMYQCLEQE